MSFSMLYPAQVIIYDGELDEGMEKAALSVLEKPGVFMKTANSGVVSPDMDPKTHVIIN